jgi:hypothetical protein
VTRKELAAVRRKKSKAHKRAKRMKQVCRNCDLPRGQHVERRTENGKTYKCVFSASYFEPQAAPNYHLDYWKVQSGRLSSTAPNISNIPRRQDGSI